MDGPSARGTTVVDWIDHERRKPARRASAKDCASNRRMRGKLSNFFRRSKSRRLPLICPPGTFSRGEKGRIVDATPHSAYNFAPFSAPDFHSFFWSHPLANIKSAKKRARQAVKRNARNSSARSMLRTSIKKVVNAIAAKDKTAAEAAYKAAEPVMDRFSSRGLIHKNKASRHKSRLSAHIKALG
jgi:small subunit ribosomal protein S20